MSLRTMAAGGMVRQLGCLPRTVTSPGDGTFKVYGTDGTPPLIPESDWDDPVWAGNSLVPFAWHVIDQSSQGSCCGCMGVDAAMVLREFGGLDRVVLSQASLYALGNGGSDRGMAIDVCLRHLMETGANPTSVIDQYDWQGFYRNRWPDNWRETAKSFRAIEAWDCPTRQHLISAVLHGFVGCYGAKAHAVCRLNRNDDLNSWGRDWGNNGIGQWANDRELDRGIQTYGGWALRVVTDPTDDGDV